MISRRLLLAQMLVGTLRAQELGLSWKRDGDEAMDEALEMLAPYGAEFGGGLSNHGPMAAEALVSLGRADAVVAWVEKYRSRLEPRETASKQVVAAEWQEALGKGDRKGSWHGLFTAELAEASWREVVAKWVPRLTPGMAAAGTHAAIRAGHAVCSLAAQENPGRIDELARALAYWGAGYLALPGRASTAGVHSPSHALSEIKLLPKDLRVGRGLITTEMKDLIGFEAFEDTIGLVNTSSGSPSFMADLLATFAGVYKNTKSNSFVFLHGVTGAASIRELMPYVKAQDRAHVLAHTWQVNAGMVARYAQTGLVAECELEPTKIDVEELAERAVASGDAHTIKLVAACLREWRRNPDPRLLAAAQRRLG